MVDRCREISRAPKLVFHWDSEDAVSEKEVSGILDRTNTGLMCSQPRFVIRVAKGERRKRLRRAFEAYAAKRSERQTSG